MKCFYYNFVSWLNFQNILPFFELFIARFFSTNVYKKSLFGRRIRKCIQGVYIFFMYISKSNFINTNKKVQIPIN